MMTGLTGGHGTGVSLQRFYKLSFLPSVTFETSISYFIVSLVSLIVKCVFIWWLFAIVL